jgi:hypothetical protein
VSVHPKRRDEHDLLITRDVYATETITNFMELSPSFTAQISSTSQEIPRILWNIKVHYRVHNSPPLAPALSQLTLRRLTTYIYVVLHR